jgi:hypothetical protein
MSVFCQTGKTTIDYPAATHHGYGVAMLILHAGSALVVQK